MAKTAAEVVSRIMLDPFSVEGNWIRLRHKKTE
jgi:hypothetical protein